MPITCNVDCVVRSFRVSSVVSRSPFISKDDCYAVIIVGSHSRRLISVPPVMSPLSRARDLGPSKLRRHCDVFFLKPEPHAWIVIVSVDAGHSAVYLKRGGRMSWIFSSERRWSRKGMTSLV